MFDVIYTTDCILSSPASSRIGDHLWRVYHLGIHPDHSASLAIRPWVGAVSTGDVSFSLEEEMASSA